MSLSDRSITTCTNLVQRRLDTVASRLEMGAMQLPEHSMMRTRYTQELIDLAHALADLHETRLEQLIKEANDG